MTQTDWDAYADTHVHDADSYLREVPQKQRIEKTADRCVGRVLDVGSSDGFSTWLIHQAGHEVHCVDISPVRIQRAKDQYGFDGTVADAADLPFADGAFDTVVLGEILEHCDNPGQVFAEAARVAKERVVISVPLNGWADPTHLWRISLDICGDRPNPMEPTKGQQVIMTWQKGLCWPQDYWWKDPKWREQFWDECNQGIQLSVRSGDD